MHQTPASEIVKEVVFGATFGLAAGYLRKLGFKSLSGNVYERQATPDVQLNFLASFQEH